MGVEERGGVVAYTDGSGTRGQYPSGAGVVVYDGGIIVAEASRHLGLGTNNHAELSGIRIALYLTSFPPFAGRHLVICSDSEYAIHMSQGVRPLDPERPNAARIMGIRRAMRGRIVRFEHVEGHVGIPGNERADQLASIARLKAWKIWPAAPKLPDPKRTFGLLLRKAREAAGVTPGQLADRLGTNALHYGNMEAGRAPPPSNLMIRVLAERIGADLEALLEAARFTRAAVTTPRSPDETIPQEAGEPAKETV